MENLRRYLYICINTREEACFWKFKSKSMLCRGKVLCANSLMGKSIARPEILEEAVMAGGWLNRKEQ